MSNVTFKFINSSDGFSRRMSFLAVPTWANLSGKLESCYTIPKDRIVISYIDIDGDDIVVSSDEELQDCIKSVASAVAGGDDQSGEAAKVVRCKVHDLSVLRSAGTESSSTRSFVAIDVNNASEIASSTTVESTGDPAESGKENEVEMEKGNDKDQGDTSGAQNSTTHTRANQEADAESDVVDYMEIDRALRDVDEISESSISGDDEDDADVALLVLDLTGRPRFGRHGYNRHGHHHGHHGFMRGAFRFDPRGRGRGFGPMSSPFIPPTDSPAGPPPHMFGIFHDYRGRIRGGFTRGRGGGRGGHHAHEHRAHGPGHHAHEHRTPSPPPPHHHHHHHHHFGPTGMPMRPPPPPGFFPNMQPASPMTAPPAAAA